MFTVLYHLLRQGNFKLKLCSSETHQVVLCLWIDLLDSEICFIGSHHLPRIYQGLTVGLISLFGLSQKVKIENILIFLWIRGEIWNENWFVLCDSVADHIKGFYLDPKRRHQEWMWCASYNIIYHIIYWLVPWLQNNLKHTSIWLYQ